MVGHFVDTACKVEFASEVVHLISHSEIEATLLSVLAVLLSSEVCQYSVVCIFMTIEPKMVLGMSFV